MAQPYGRSLLRTIYCAPPQCTARSRSIHGPMHCARVEFALTGPFRVIQYEWMRRLLASLVLVGIGLLAAGCSRPFPDGDEYWALSGLLGIAGIQHFIFVSTGTYNGNLGGVSGADASCATEKSTNFATLPGAPGDYAALLTDGALRVACTTANCGGGTAEHTDWVLLPSTSYYRPDGQLLFQSDASGIFAFGTLSHPFSSSGADEWWTGLASDWTAILHCLVWANSTAGQTGFFGSGNMVDGNSISTINLTCNTPRHILCVRR